MNKMDYEFAHPLVTAKESLSALCFSQMEIKNKYEK
jgi:hypothetical protein